MFQGRMAWQPGGSRPFRAPYPGDEGLPVDGGYDLRIPVTFTPVRVGTVTGSYRFSWKDRAGPHTLTVPITASAVK